MYHIFKNLAIKPVTNANITEALKAYTGKSLIPPGFKIQKEDSRQFIRREIQFIDFKQAINFVNLIASTFTRLQHQPKIFNVYNKVIVDFGEETSNTPTTKDAFLARILFELQNNPLIATSKALEDLNCPHK